MKLYLSICKIWSISMIFTDIFTKFAANSKNIRNLDHPKIFYKEFAENI